MKAWARLFALFAFGMSVCGADIDSFSLRDVVEERTSGAVGYSLLDAPAGSAPLYLAKEVLLDGRVIERAAVREGGNGTEILLTFTKEGGQRFGTITGQRIGKQIGILINGVLYAAPVVAAEITGGSVVITGNFTEAQAEALAAKLNRSQNR